MNTSQEILQPLAKSENAEPQTEVSPSLEWTSPDVSVVPLDTTQGQFDTNDFNSGSS